MTDQNSYTSPQQPNPYGQQPLTPPNPYGGSAQTSYQPQPQYPQPVNKSNTGLTIGLIIGGIVIVLAAILTIVAVVYVLYVFGAVAEGTTGKNPYTGGETSSGWHSPHQDNLLPNSASVDAEFLL